MNYDRKYDTARPSFAWVTWHTRCNCRMCKGMRGTGVEPVSLSAPDPKSGHAPDLVPFPPASAGVAATERYTPLPNDTQSTTNFATSNPASFESRKQDEGGR